MSEVLIALGASHMSLELIIVGLYLLAIIYKSVIICKGCYVTVTAPINKDLQLPLHTISIKFPRTFFIHILTHVLT